VGTLRQQSLNRAPCLYFPFSFRRGKGGTSRTPFFFGMIWSRRSEITRILPFFPFSVPSNSIDGRFSPPPVGAAAGPVETRRRRSTPHCRLDLRIPLSSPPPLSGRFFPPRKERLFRLRPLPLDRPPDSATFCHFVPSPTSSDQTRNSGVPCQRSPAGAFLRP